MLAPMHRASVFALALAGAACGPITYVSEVSHGASNAVDLAREAHADKYSPYYWTRAVNYLQAARESVARADFQGANRFGRLAREAAELAANEATTAPKTAPVKEVAPAKEVTPPPVAPAKEPVAPAKDSE